MKGSTDVGLMEFIWWLYQQRETTNCIKIASTSITTCDIKRVVMIHDYNNYLWLSKNDAKKKQQQNKWQQK